MINSQDNQGTKTQGGFACPECGNTIITTMEMLVTQKGVGCTHCGLRLDIDMETSGAVMQDIKKVYDSHRAVEEINEKQGA